MQSIRWVIIALILLFAASSSRGDFSFYLVDNFESNSTAKWYAFGNIKIAAQKNPLTKTRDLIADSCGNYLLSVKGSSSDWYVGGIGTDLALDATAYSRFQADINGSSSGGKLRIELYDDDNGNGQIEQDKNWQPLYDDKWVVEIPILGPGFTRISIPFTAFVDENPGKGDDKWNPSNENGSGGLVRAQIIFVSKEKTGDIDVGLDNILLTF